MQGHLSQRRSEIRAGRPQDRRRLGVSRHTRSRGSRHRIGDRGRDFGARFVEGERWTKRRAGGRGTVRQDALRDLTVELKKLSA